MDRIIKKILETIEDEGYEAYLVGGYVRDFFLGKTSYDVDICTNALPKDLHRIFPNSNNSNSYGGFNLKIKKYNIDITTYRKEIKYENRRPTEMVYINNLLEDLNRRDFTINALCMGRNEVLIDPLNGMNDIKSKTIKMIGDPNYKLKEDPLRILRAIRFSTVLYFNIDSTLENAIINNASLVGTLSGIRIKEEINKILLSDNYKQGLKLLKEYKLNKYLSLDYNKVIKCSDIHMMWAQIETNKVPFAKVEQDCIKKLKEIIKMGTISELSLYKYGLYLNMAASDYFGISKQHISKMYKNLPIKSDKDIKLSMNAILKVLDLKPSKKIKELKEDISRAILERKIRNNKKSIYRYVLEYQRKWKDE